MLDIFTIFVNGGNCEERYLELTTISFFNGSMVSDPRPHSIIVSTAIFMFLCVLEPEEIYCLTLAKILYFLATQC